MNTRENARARRARRNRTRFTLAVASSSVRSARDHTVRAIGEALLGELPESKRNAAAAVNELRAAIRLASPYIDARRTA